MNRTYTGLYYDVFTGACLTDIATGNNRYFPDDFSEPTRNGIFRIISEPYIATFWDELLQDETTYVFVDIVEETTGREFSSVFWESSVVCS